MFVIEHFANQLKQLRKSAFKLRRRFKVMFDDDRDEFKLIGEGVNTEIIGINQALAIGRMIHLFA